jgi:hypothetical protein
MAAKREKSECYNCTEQFPREHLKTRLMKGIYLLQLDDDPPLKDTMETEDPLISLNAIMGIADADPMQLAVCVGDQLLGALVDSGSTHSFISVVATSRLHLDPMPLPSLRVKVANGDRVATTDVYRKTRIYIISEEFIIDLFVIPVDSCDMVLGLHWLCTLGPILWDFMHDRMSCWRDDHRAMWHGTIGPTVHAMATTDLMGLLLDELEDVFTTPNGLSPPHCFNHRIHLLLGMALVAVWPYHYPQVIKDELEHQCWDMLNQGIILASSFAFPSSVLLVKKHDSSWRFWIDYRTLNAKMVCDMYLIPIVDRLLDKLCSARFYTKLDLCSYYHQVWMHDANVAKAAFHMHHGQFEFLVMPFGLMNAPTMFPALMHDILHDFLCQFILVFFEDILIYSDSGSSHLQHVHVVL